MELTWTTDSPTKPGWYWVKKEKKRSFIAEVAYVNEKLCVWYHSGIFGRRIRNNVSIIERCQWAGPIEKPLKGV